MPDPMASSSTKPLPSAQSIRYPKRQRIPSFVSPVLFDPDCSMTNSSDSDAEPDLLSDPEKTPLDITKHFDLSNEAETALPLSLPQDNHCPLDLPNPAHSPSFKTWLATLALRIREMIIYHHHNLRRPAPELAERECFFHPRQQSSREMAAGEAAGSQKGERDRTRTRTRRQLQLQQRQDEERERERERERYRQRQAPVLDIPLGTQRSTDEPEVFEKGLLVW